MSEHWGFETEVKGRDCDGWDGFEIVKASRNGGTLGRTTSPLARKILASVQEGDDPVATYVRVCACDGLARDVLGCEARLAMKDPQNDSHDPLAAASRVCCERARKALEGLARPLD